MAKIKKLLEAQGFGSIYVMLMFEGCDLYEILHCSHFATDDLTKYDEIVKCCDDYFESGVIGRELTFDKKSSLGKEDQPILLLTKGDPFIDLKDKLSAVATYKYPKFIPHISVTSNVTEFTGKTSQLIISKDGQLVKKYAFTTDKVAECKSNTFVKMIRENRRKGIKL